MSDNDKTLLSLSANAEDEVIIELDTFGVALTWDEALDIGCILIALSAMCASNLSISREVIEDKLDKARTHAMGIIEEARV